jgi:magnesium transporter
MNRHLDKLVKKTGLAPGTPIHIGPEYSDPTIIEQCLYTNKTASLTKINAVSDINLEQTQLSWLDIRGLKDITLLTNIAAVFKLHGLIIEDISNTLQLPKLDEHDDSYFLILKLINFDNNHLSLDHICVYFEKNTIITFQEKSQDNFTVIKDRILKQKSKLNEKQSDYLLYTLFDYIVDTYFIALQQLDNRLIELTKDVDTHSSKNTLIKIQKTKKQLLTLNHLFWYTRNIALNLKKSDSNLITKSTFKYFNDLHDHISHIIDISESFREELIDLTERHLSSINLKSNEIMKTLTIVTAIFMPLTFLAGIYGMNFKVMPELEFRFAYPILIVAMLIITGILLLIFKRKKWLN